MTGKQFEFLIKVLDGAKLRIVNEFDKLGFSDISDWLKYDEKGVQFFDSSTVDTRVVKNVKCTKKVHHKKDGEMDETIEM